MANDDFSQSGRRRPGTNSGLSVVRMSDLPTSAPTNAPTSAAPVAPPMRPAMPVAAPARPPTISSATTSSLTPSPPPPPPPLPAAAPLSFTAASTTGAAPSGPRSASSITGGIPRHIGALDADVEPSLPRPRPATRVPSQAPVADVNAVLSALGVADAPPPPPPPPSAVTQQGFAAKALQVVGVSVLVGAAAFAAFTWRDGPATFSDEQRRLLVDTWLRTNAWGRVRSDEVVNAVNTIGATVVPAAQKAAVRFVVVDGPLARAEMLPDGTVVVTTAALRTLRSDAELAAVLAHALAHEATGERRQRLDDNEHARGAQRALASSNPHTAAPIVDDILAMNSSADEGAIVAATQRLLEAGGWQPHALADAVTRLQASRAWHATLTPSLTHTLEQLPTAGRKSAEAYTRDVLDRIGHQR